jgi:ABC-2 type transport system ATP-binding protein
MSSHILQEIQATVDRIIIIHNGKLVADGTSEELINDAKGLTQLNLEISNANDNTIQDMKATIPSINVKSVKKSDNKTEVVLEYQNTSDPRKDVFEYAVKNEWVITEMRASKRNLEDIFRNLTSKGGSAHA